MTKNDGSSTVRWLTLTDAAAQLRVRYAVARDLALQGRLVMRRGKGNRIHVTAASVAKLKQERDGE